MGHSKEPWRKSATIDDAITSDDGYCVATYIRKDDVRRIIACVNVLSEWTTEELEEVLARGSRIRLVRE